MIDAKIRYNNHKQSAKIRNIPFHLTFDEWYNWWFQHGIDKNYPTIQGSNRPCMCRFNDQGSYELTNIYFDTNSNNMKHRIPLNGIRNGNSKKIKTPLGIFDCKQDAAKAHKITRNMIYKREKLDSQNYYTI